MTVTIATVLSEGNAIGDVYALAAIDVLTEVNRVPRATLVYIDGDIPNRRFPLADSGLLAPGKEIEIKIRQGDAADASLFKGLVFRVRFDVVSRRLTVEAKDKAFRLTQGRRSHVFPELTDSDAIGRLIEDAGLTKGDIPSTLPTNERLVQYNASDWDFIVSRADVHGLVVIVDAGTVSLKAMEVSGSASRRFDLDETILDVELEVDGSHQHPGFAGVGWDVAQQQPTSFAQAAAVSLGQGNLNPDNIGSALGLAAQTLSSMAPLPPDELQAWADARMKRARLSMIRGRVRAQAVTDVKPMDVVDLTGFGGLFDGTALVTGVRQRYSVEGGWRTDVQFGLAATPFCQEPDIVEADAAGMLPAVRGLQVGIVGEYEDDPELRVKVVVPAIATETDNALWARLATPDAGDGRGVLFRPETGDEVVVGFLNNDPRHPIILGSLFGSKHKAPDRFASLSADNIDKGIVSKTGATIHIADDGDPVLTLKTPKGQVLIDDKNKVIELSDGHGNKITLSDAGVEIKSANDLILDGSNGNVKIKGSAVDVA